MVGAHSHRPDAPAAEEPVESVGGRPLAVTLRTPGADVDLAVGFLVGEGVVRSADAVRSARYRADATVDGGSTCDAVALAPGVAAPDVPLERGSWTTSSGFGFFRAVQGAQSNTTVLCPLSSTRRSQCQRTARDSARASASRPTVCNALGS